MPPQSPARKREHVDPQVWVVEAFIRLRLVGALEAECAHVVDAAVKHRICAARPQVVAVVLGLDETTAIDERGCVGLSSVRHDLTTMRIQFRLAVRSSARYRLERSGMLARIGADTIHPSIRAGVLAAYETVPGPAVVTPAIRDALTQPPETVTLAPVEPADAAAVDLT